MANNESDVRFRVIDLGAEAKKMWGPKWGAPEVVYQFSDREFVERTADAAIYAGTTSSGDEILAEDDEFWLLEDGGEWVQE